MSASINDLLKSNSICRSSMVLRSASICSSAALLTEEKLPDDDESPLPRRSFSACFWQSSKLFCLKELKPSCEIPVPTSFSNVFIFSSYASYIFVISLYATSDVSILDALLGFENEERID